MCICRVIRITWLGVRCFRHFFTIWMLQHAFLIYGYKSSRIEDRSRFNFAVVQLQRVQVPMGLPCFLRLVPDRSVS